jgi:hypothetical protein
MKKNSQGWGRARLYAVPAMIAWLISGNVGHCQTNETGLPPQADAGWAWGEDSAFWSGLFVGFAAGGSAWIFRMVRQAATQNPEI